MLMLSILTICLLGGVTNFAFRASWSIFKFILGLCLFVCFPVLMVLMVLGAIVSHFLPLILIAGLFYMVFRKS